jgi:hypothetical protein
VIPLFVIGARAIAAITDMELVVRLTICTALVTSLTELAIRLVPLTRVSLLVLPFARPAVPAVVLLAGRVLLGIAQLTTTTAYELIHTEQYTVFVNSLVASEPSSVISRKWL